MARVFKIVFCGILVFAFFNTNVWGEDKEFFECSQRTAMWNPTRYEFNLTPDYSDTIVIERKGKFEATKFRNSFFPFSYLCYFEDCVNTVIWKEKSIVIIKRKICGSQTNYLYHYWNM